MLSPYSFVFHTGPAGSQWTWRKKEQQRQEESPVVSRQQPEEQQSQKENGWNWADPGGSWTDRTEHENPREGIAWLR